MTFQDATRMLASLSSAGILPGTQRMERALALLQNPHQRLRVVHVAGTNGKGSVSAMIRSILTAAGYRAGLYTSPAVPSLRDTVSIDGAAISENAFAALFEDVASLLPLLENVGPLVDANSQEKPLSIALREIAEDLLECQEIDPEAEARAREEALKESAFDFTNPFASPDPK